MPTSPENFKTVVRFFLERDWEIEQIATMMEISVESAMNWADKIREEDENEYDPH